MSGNRPAEEGTHAPAGELYVIGATAEPTLYLQEPGPLQWREPDFGHVAEPGWAYGEIIGAEISEKVAKKVRSFNRRRRGQGSFAHKGTVKWYNANKGYGFIQPDDGGTDVFVPFSALEQAGIHHLRPNQKVEYEAQPDAKTGQRVTRVRGAD